MNLLIECEATLSKKLEKICENDENIIIHITSIKGNKGNALIRMSCKDDISIEEIKNIGETSLMLKVINSEEDIPEFNNQSTISSFFDSQNLSHKNEIEQKIVAHSNPEIQQGKPWKENKPQKQITIEEKMAQKIEQKNINKKPVNIPNKTIQQEVPQEKPIRQEKPKEKPIRQDASRNEIVNESIMSYDDLIKSIKQVKDIDKEISVDNKKLSRNDAIKVEMSVPRINDRCYIGNNLKATLSISDIVLSQDHCLSLAPSQIIDISRFPAKKIRDSSDLEWCIRTGKIGFFTKEEYLNSFAQIAQNLEGSSKSTLQIYDSSKEAKNKFLSKASVADNQTIIDSDVTEIEVDENNNVPYEDDRDMENLITLMPKNK